MSMFEIPEGVNPDLAEERTNITFDQEELTNYLDGGLDKTTERRALEKFVIHHPMLKEKSKVVVETLGRDEKYKYEIERACRLLVVARLAEDEGHNDVIRSTLSAGLGAAILPDGNPISLHFVMFLPTLMGQATPQQMSEMVGRAWNLEIVGTYAQTELGHGTFIRGLELQAEYDPESQEFELNSPCLTSFKWWPGGLGRTATHAVVMAQLITRGQQRGVHPFLVQLRDEQTNKPFPGILVGEIGPKLGMNANDNGYLGFNHFRIPLSSMLGKNARVEPDGTYVSPPRAKLGYATMIFVRAALSLDITTQLQKAITIAIRYSAVRRQGQPQPGKLEPKILDYPTQQAKLMPSLAVAVGFKIASKSLWEMYNDIQGEVDEGEYENLPELHALSCAMKALITSDSAAAVDTLRKACGGHGFMTNSSLPRIFGMVTAACTYEGENTVLQLQVARYLLKCATQALESVPQPPSVSYLNNSFNHKQNVDLVSDFGMVELFEKVAAGLVNALLEDDNNTILSTQAAELHSRSFVVYKFAEELNNVRGMSVGLRKLMTDLYRLLATTWILQSSTYFLRYAGLTFEHLDQLTSEHNKLLQTLRNNAVCTVDSFDFRDEILGSSLGCYDGWVYHHLFQSARDLGEVDTKPEDTVSSIMKKIQAKL